MADSRRILVLGAGRVSRPIVQYFLGLPGYRVSVASLYREHAEALVDDHPDGEATDVDVTDDGQVNELVGNSDLVVSLVPYAYHVQVARHAIEHGTQMVTTSYVSPEMRALDEPARQAGVLILNETGLDPGIDHLSAMRLIDEVHGSGRRIVSFASCTGGLPAPESNDNPWGYKFSWSPRGALLAGMQSARFLRDGRIHVVPGALLFDHAEPYEIEGLATFEMYPNRDALRYVDLYALQGTEGFLRGTLRFPGWSETMKAVAELGLLDDHLHPDPDATYASFVESRLAPGPGSLRERVAAHIDRPVDHVVLDRLEWSGLFDDRPIENNEGSSIDLLAGLFQQRMAYAEGETDMIVMRHEVVSEGDAGDRRRHVSLLVQRGHPVDGDSAIARTVSLPAAAAARMILEGRLKLTGVHVPVTREIYAPVLDELAQLGIRFDETVEPV